MINSSVIQLECKFERIREVVGFCTERCGIAPNTSDDLSFIRLIKQQEVIDPIHTWRKSKWSVYNRFWGNHRSAKVG